MAPERMIAKTGVEATRLMERKRRAACHAADATARNLRHETGGE